MNELGVSPNSTTYTLIIQRYVADQNLELAVQYLYAMKARHLLPDLKAIQAVIILAAKLGYTRLALDLAVWFESQSARRIEHTTWMKCLISAAEALYVSP